MSPFDPPSVWRPWHVVVWSAVGILTFYVGLNLIYAALGLGISYIAFEHVISNVVFGLAALVSGLATMRAAGRAGKRLQQLAELAKREDASAAIRRAAFGDGNGHGGA